MLDLRGIGRVYGSDPPVEALKGVDLVIEQGESIAIIGPSGSGKSTLLNIVGCLDRQTSGSYLIDGIDVDSLDESERAGLRGRRIGFVFQAFHLLTHRTVLENVMLSEVYVGRSREGRERRARAELERVGVGDRAEFLPINLSGGQSQRVAIARALLGEPALLLCDEPTGNLDSASTEALLEVFDELRAEGTTMVVITHDEEVAGRIPRRARIIDGQLTEEG